jgi:hypothetical protein
MSDTLTTDTATGPAPLPPPDPADRVNAVLTALRPPGIPAHGWAYPAEAIRPEHAAPPRLPVPG